LPSALLLTAGTTATDSMPARPSFWDVWEREAVLTRSGATAKGVASRRLCVNSGATTLLRDVMKELPPQYPATTGSSRREFLST